jgi:HSP20 family protein
MNIIRYQRYPGLDRLATVREEMDRAFQSSFGSFFQPFAASERTPALDVHQDKDQFTVVVELPGMKKEEIEITLDNSVLTIAGERKQEGNEQEVRSTKFQRSVTLPIAVATDKITATYENGLLQVVLPKAEEAKPKRISLN